ncbi:MAG: HAD hydrolase-like protein [Patescibacteria group bacterium]|nr:HAD hydrolase-like protein [Patescibacteria group bacterium]MDE2588270.1 HAD hydrolase-like protein [Patescibacteria group bacterium]
MKYSYLLFDLDGTLTDPKIGITKSVQYALKKMGIEEDLANLTKFIGPPLGESFEKYYGFTNDRRRVAVDNFREYFSTQGLFENEVIEGIAEMLELLGKHEKIMYVATSKPTFFSEQIIQHFHLDTHFTKIVGANLDETKTDKAEIIADILSLHPNVDKKHFVMIGDRKHDIIGAQKMGIDSIAVGFGYGSEEELQKVNATYYVSTVKQLEELLLTA